MKRARNCKLNTRTLTIEEVKTMACEHKRLRCTDGIFYCLDCGARVDAPKAPEAAREGKTAATEAQEPKKRRARKGATKE